MFDLYFAGTQSDASNELLSSLNANILLSWYHNKKRIEDVVAQKRDGTYSGKLFIDSGAFTAHRKDIDLNVDDYINYVNERDDAIDLFAQIDTIPGKFGQEKTRQQIKDAVEGTRSNYLYMVDKVKSPEKLIPVFHQGEDFEQLDWILNLQVNGKPIPYIGVSGSKSLSARERFEWYVPVYARIHASNNPNVKVHCFGNSSIKHMKSYPFTSSDATSWLKIAANGNIITKYGIMEVSNKSLYSRTNINSNRGLKDFEEYVEKLGYTLEQLQNDYASRANWNIQFLFDWSQNHTYKGKKVFKDTRLF